MKDVEQTVCQRLFMRGSNYVSLARENKLWFPGYLEEINLLFVEIVAK